MAFIVKFERAGLQRPRLHPTQVRCEWSVFRSDGRTLMQLDTRGSDTREKPGKLSQTLQLDVSAARALVEILTSEFDL
jgi:hypothetical protein